MPRCDVDKIDGFPLLETEILTIHHQTVDSGFLVSLKHACTVILFSISLVFLSCFLCFSY